MQLLTMKGTTWPNLGLMLPIQKGMETNKNLALHQRFHSDCPPPGGKMHLTGGEADGIIFLITLFGEAPTLPPVAA